MSTARLSFPVSLAALALAGLSPGCAEEAPGSLVVPVQLGNNLTCDETDVSDLRAFVGDGDYAEQVDCDKMEVQIDDIPAGNYSLTVQGLANDGTAVMDNLGGDDREVRVVGDGATVTAKEQLLTDAPARLLVRWSTEYTTCEEAGIERFDVTAYRTGGTSILLTGEFSCATPPDDDDGYRVLPDPDRRLDGYSFGGANIQESGTSTDLSFEFDPPGPGRPFRISLACTAAGCVEE